MAPNSSTTSPSETTLHGDTEVTDFLDGHDAYYTTDRGAAYVGDSRDLLRDVEEGSINLIITSPPFALQRQKEYGNEKQEEYISWFMDFAKAAYDVLAEDGSFVIDIGGSWQKGKPVRSLYHFELLTELAGSKGPYELAQDFYWHNPAKMPTPAQWVTIERIRIADSVNHLWWLSKTERPKADNTRVLQEYSDAMENLLENGYNDEERPSGHNPSDTFDDPKEKGSIPKSFFNWFEQANTASNTHYLRACRELDIDPHPARFPRQLPAFFVRFLTEPGDTVLDIFAGSNTTGRVAENFGRNWLAFDTDEEYLKTSQLRFTTMDDLETGGIPPDLPVDQTEAVSD